MGSLAMEGIAALTLFTTIKIFDIFPKLYIIKFQFTILYASHMVYWYFLHPNLHM